MELTSVYRRAPGCCSVCGNPSTAHGVIDLQAADQGMLARTFDLYLCGDCALQIAKLIAPTRGKQLVNEGVMQELAMVNNELMVAKAKLAEYEQTFAMIRQIGGDDVG